jgi:hypothetical protein
MGPKKRPGPAGMMHISCTLQVETLQSVVCTIPVTNNKQDIAIGKLVISLFPAFLVRAQVHLEMIVLQAAMLDSARDFRRFD